MSTQDLKNKNNPHGLFVGQFLWYQSNKRWKRSSYVVVEKIGRQWATVRDADTDMIARINLMTLQADGAGYSSPGTCYFSKEDYEREVALQNEWDAFVLDVKYRRTPDVTVEDILQARLLLKVPKNE